MVVYVGFESLYISLSSSSNRVLESYVFLRTCTAMANFRSSSGIELYHYIFSLSRIYTDRRTEQINTVAMLQNINTFFTRCRPSLASPSSLLKLPLTLNDNFCTTS